MSKLNSQGNEIENSPTSGGSLAGPAPKLTIFSAGVLMFVYDTFDWLL